MLNVMSEAMGIPFTPSDFGTQELYADWADTHVSEALLKYQRATVAELRARTFARYRWRRYFMGALCALDQARQPRVAVHLRLGAQARCAAC
jgi:hypothetical protein